MIGCVVLPENGGYKLSLGSLCSSFRRWCLWFLEGEVPMLVPVEGGYRVSGDVRMVMMMMMMMMMVMMIMIMVMVRVMIMVLVVLGGRSADAGACGRGISSEW